LTVADLSSRPPTRADAQAVTELVIACDIEEFGAPDFELDDLLADWNRPGFDLQRHAVVVLDGERIVAYAGFARPDYADVYVHPDYRNRGIGSELLAWTERRALEQFEPDADIRLGQVVTANRGGARTLLERAGYEPVRTYWRMEMMLEGAPPRPAWPEGVRVRTFDVERDARAVHALVEDAFADNERHDTQTFEEWQAFMIDREAFEPGLWFVAEAAGEVAGVVLCPDYQTEGWVRQLAMDKRWRYRGLGTALLRQAMTEFHRRGRDRIGLVVDSWNRTGAKELYERAGMHVAREHTRMEKELRAPRG
jgi:mycothiol synthase